LEPLVSDALAETRVAEVIVEAPSELLERDASLNAPMVTAAVDCCSVTVLDMAL